MTLRLVFRPAPRADIEEIWEFTAKRWSAAQADRYVRAIGNTCARLAAGRLRGRDASEARPGYRRQAVGRHLVFFHVSRESTLVIVRVLHQSMDIDAHLGD